MKILTALQVVLTKGEMYQSLDKGAKNLDAYLKRLKAMQLNKQFNREAVAIARRYAEEAIEIDPGICRRVQRARRSDNKRDVRR